jgi:hypothetical protein
MNQIIFHQHLFQELNLRLQKYPTNKLRRKNV